MLEQYIEKICQELNIEEKVEQEGNLFSFPFSDAIQITMKKLDPGFSLTAHIDTLVKEKKEDFFIQLMRANLFGQGTGGSVIGIDPEEKFLTLSSEIPYEVDYKGFREKLEDFVNYLLYWREETENHRKTLTEPFL